MGHDGIGMFKEEGWHGIASLTHCYRAYDHVLVGGSNLQHPVTACRYPSIRRCHQCSPSNRALPETARINTEDEQRSVTLRCRSFGTQTVNSAAQYRYNSGLNGPCMGRFK